MRNSALNRKIAMSLLSLCLIFPLAGPVFAASDVSDIRGHWAEERISAWMEEGRIAGYTDGTFKPNRPVTRAEFVALVNRAFGFRQAGPVPFKDMGREHWAYADVAIAVRAGYITGYGDGTFGPSREISRQEAAVIAVRLLDARSAAQAEAGFADYGEIAEWARDAVNLAYERGFVTGYPEDRTFRPRQSVTRAEAVVLLDRVLGARAVVHDEPGTYGPSVGTEEVPRDVVVKAPGVKLRNMVIHGSLTLAEEIGEGDVFLENVTVRGETFIRGGGENSVHVTDSVLVSVIVDKKTGGIRIVVEGETTVAEVVINTPATLDASEAAAAIASVKLSEQLPQGSKVTLVGTFETVEAMGSEITVEIPAGSVGNFVAGETSAGMTLNLGQEAKVASLILDAVAKVTGEGSVAKVTVSKKVQAEAVIEVEVEEVVYSGDDDGEPGQAEPEETQPPGAPPTPNPPPTPDPPTSTTPGPPDTAVRIDLKGVAVAGQYRVGETLEAVTDPGDATASYRWQRADDEDGDYADIEGADAKTYVIGEEDEGKWIRVRAAGTGSYAGEVTSKAQRVAAKEPETVPVTAVQVTPASLVLTVGDKATLEAAVEPSNATNPDVSWTSDNPSVAAVDDTGEVTTVAPGAAKIAAVSKDDPSVTASVEVRVISGQADVETQDFGIVSGFGVVGYNVGFRLIDATAADVEKIVITLYNGSTELASAISGKVLDNYAEHAVLSAPFDVLGTFDYGNDEGGNWIYSGWQGRATDIPDRAVVAVTYRNGVVKTAEHSQLTGDPGIFTAGTFGDTAYWGNPASVFYYFSFTLREGYKYGDLASFEATAYDGDRRLSTIRLREESFVNYADNTTLGGSFRSHPDEVSGSWHLEPFDGTMPTAIVVEYAAKDGKSFRAVLENPAWQNQGYKPVANAERKIGYDSIQAAIDAATAGDNTILVGPRDHGTGEIAIRQREGVNIALVAAGDVVLRNPIRIDGDGRWNGDETLVIQGFVFDFSESDSEIIISAQKGELGSNKNNYAHNILIEDVRFIGNPSAEVAAVKTTNGSVFGLVIRNCEGVHLHSLGQLHVARGFTIENCVVTGGESGVNYYGNGDVFIRNLTVEGANYGVRAGQSSGLLNANATLTIESSALTALYPVWLRGDAPHLVTLRDTELSALEGGAEIRNNAGSAVVIES